MSKNKRATPELKANVYDLIKSNLIRMKTQEPNITRVVLRGYEVRILYHPEDGSVIIYNPPFDEGPLLRGGYSFKSLDDAIAFDFEADAENLLKTLGPIMS
jgi:hypothetical protein